jgi:hypothetical protein
MMTSLLANGKPHFVYIDEGTKKMWWIMPDFETVRMFKTGKENWVEIPPEDWKMADIEFASQFPDFAREYYEDKHA